MSPKILNNCGKIQNENKRLMLKLTIFMEVSSNLPKNNKIFEGFLP